MVLMALVFGGAASAEPQYDALVVNEPMSAVVLASEQTALIADVNRARRTRGLGDVSADLLLSRAAQMHAENMARRRFFGHTGPDGSSLPDRLAVVGFIWKVAAENIALAADESAANDSMLKSPAHSANILDARVEKIGVSALAIGRHATLYVEDFAQ